MRVWAEHPKRQDAGHLRSGENQLRGLEIDSFGGGLLYGYYTELGLPLATHRLHLCDKKDHRRLWMLVVDIGESESCWR